MSNFGVLNNGTSLSDIGALKQLTSSWQAGAQEASFKAAREKNVTFNME
jgi:hypothetical protein